MMGWARPGMARQMTISCSMCLCVCISMTWLLPTEPANVEHLESPNCVLHKKQYFRHQFGRKKFAFNIKHTHEHTISPHIHTCRCYSTQNKLENSM